MKAHTEIIDAAVSATCTTDGKTEGKHCSVCNETLVAQNIVPASHQYSSNYESNNSFHWFKCANCEAENDKEEHTADDYGICTICNELVGATEGIIYAISADNKYYEVIGYDGVATRIQIPSEHNGLPVKSIYKDSFYNNNIITSIIIPESITSIGDNAFRECNNLTKVVIGDNVATIGSSAFSGCNRLEFLDMGNSITSIGGDAFRDCSRLSSVNLPNTITIIEGWVFDGCENLVLNEYNNGKYIGNKSNPYLVLIGVTSNTITSFEIHSDTHIIAGTAFYDCGRLSNVIIHTNTISIGMYAFAWCESLMEIKFTGTSNQWDAIHKSVMWNIGTATYNVKFNYQSEK